MENTVNAKHINTFTDEIQIGTRTKLTTRWLILKEFNAGLATVILRTENDADALKL